MALNLPNFLSLMKPQESDMQSIMSKELQNSFDRVRNKYAEPNAQLGLQGKELKKRFK